MYDDGCMYVCLISYEALPQKSQHTLVGVSLTSALAYLQGY